MVVQYDCESWEPCVDIELTIVVLQWRHNERDCISPAPLLFILPFVLAQVKENIEAPRHWPLWGEFTGEFPAQKASNAENVSIWWRHHGSENDNDLWFVLLMGVNKINIRSGYR